MVKNPRVNKKKLPEKKVNRLELNICEEPGCQCGWNIRLGSSDYTILDKLEQWIEEINRGTV